jgi:kynurenine formamidase
VVDLTPVLGPGTIPWPGSAGFAAEVVTEVDTDGVFERVISLPEHIGAHVDAPAHFVSDGVTVDGIPAERLLVAAHVVDVRASAERNPDYTLEASAIEGYEAANGPIEDGSAVLMRTGWDARLADRERYYGGLTAEEHHFPGFGRSAAEMLVARGVVGLGIDSASIDSGSSSGFPVHKLTMAAGLWHVEVLANLGALPARGALLFVGVLRLAGGSGAPARVLALLSDKKETDHD